MPGVAAYTEEALQRRALKTGAAVKIDGVVHNAGRAVVVPRAPAPAVVAAPAAPPTPAPTPTPAPAPIPLPDKELLKAVDFVGSVAVENLALLRAVLAAIKAIPQPVLESRPRKWTFNVKRDERTGLLSSLEAIASED